MEKLNDLPFDSIAVLTTDDATRATASNLEQVANLLCAQANSASYPQMSSRYGYGVKTSCG